jgi:hypothetical protein
MNGNYHPKSMEQVLEDADREMLKDQDAGLCKELHAVALSGDDVRLLAARDELKKFHKSSKRQRDESDDDDQEMSRNKKQ